LFFFNCNIYIYIEDISYENGHFIWEWWEYLTTLWSKLIGWD
jgi:hypothetical protein